MSNWPTGEDVAIVAAAAVRRDWPDELQLAVSAGRICAVLRTDFGGDDEEFVENLDGLDGLRLCRRLLAAICAAD